jgi:hypothetical protein
MVFGPVEPHFSPPQARRSGAQRVESAFSGLDVIFEREKEAGWQGYRRLRDTSSARQARALPTV